MPKFLLTFALYWARKLTDTTGSNQIYFALILRPITLDCKVNWPFPFWNLGWWCPVKGLEKSRNLSARRRKKKGSSSKTELTGSLTSLLYVQPRFHLLRAHNGSAFTFGCRCLMRTPSYFTALGTQKYLLDIYLSFEILNRKLGIWRCFQNSLCSMYR